MENTYKALLVEDIKDTSEYIVSRIIKLCPSIPKVDQAFSIDDAYNLIKTNQYDIVFLDIQLPSGTSFDLLKRLDEESAITFEIIFITGESAKEYTLSAIKYSAIDFLYKPLDDEELVLALHKAITKLSSQAYNHQVKLLLERIVPNQPQSNRIAFHLHNGILEFFDVRDILYMEAEGVISSVYFVNSNPISINRNLGFYKDLLLNDYNFVMASNSLIVNANFIKRYNHRELTITLTNGKNIYTSRRYGKELKDSLQAMTKKTGFFSFLTKGRN